MGRSAGARRAESRGSTRAEPARGVRAGAREARHEPVSGARDGGLRLLATVTFNPNQLRAHLEPILELDEVDAVPSSPTGLPRRCRSCLVVPDARLVRSLGRAGANVTFSGCAARAARLGDRIQPVPHGINARTAGQGRGAHDYAMIGGPVEWDEGGWRSDNVSWAGSRALPPLERLLLRSSAVARRCRDGRAGPGLSSSAASRPSGQSSSRPHRRRALLPAPAGPRRYDVLTVGALIYTKRQVVIEAVARLRGPSGDPAAIVGDGPLEGELRELPAARASRRGRLLGFRDDVEASSAGAAFVLPSRYEGLSVAMLEAMASGLPAFVTDVGELRGASATARTASCARPATWVGSSDSWLPSWRTRPCGGGSGLRRPSMRARSPEGRPWGGATASCSGALPSRRT